MPSLLKLNKEVFAVQYIIAFTIGGAICALAQIVMDTTKYTPAHILVGLVVIGAVLNGFGLYEPFIKWAGAGALIPVSGFGNSITTGVVEEVKRIGWLGLLSGIFDLTGLGIAAAIVYGFVSATLFNTHK